MNKEFWLTMDDKVEIYTKKWFDPSIKPKAIVQLSHGMAEHINRYDAFAAFLVDQHIFVYGNDHRGHGKTGDQQGLLGFFDGEDGFEKVKEDLFQVTRRIKDDYPGVPVFLFGHSMGSFLARSYIQDYSQAIEGVILSGTGYYPSLTTKIGKRLARALPPRAESKFMNSIAFGANNRRIKNKSSDFDWLTNDEEAVQAYIDDPHTGFIPTARFFFDLMTGILEIHDKRRNSTIRPDLPILLISGDADPIGKYGKGVWRTAHLLKKAGIKDVAIFLFENGRHELLNERNKKEVFAVIDAWLLKRL